MFSVLFISVFLVGSASALPDLYVDSFTSPDAADPGEAIGSLLSLYAGNQGDEDAVDFHVGIYISEDPVITRSDELMIGGREHVDLVEAGGVEEVWLLLAMRVPAHLAPGDYHIGPLLDELEAIEESDEQNNDYSNPITISALPELYVETFTAPPQANPGEAVGDLVTLFTGNQGYDNAGAFSVGIYISEDEVITTSDDLLIDGRENAGPLAIGVIEEVSFLSGMSIPSGLVPGPYHIGVLLDEFDDIYEADEFNNYVSFPIYIGTELPDLYVDSFVAPSEAEPGEAIGSLMDLFVGNQGDANSGGFSVGIYISDDPVIATSDQLLIGGREHVDPLAPGEVVDVWLLLAMAIPEDTEPGEYFIGPLLDETGQVEESDETNNYVSYPISITGGGLEVVLEGYPAWVEVGGTLDFTAGVENTGDEPAAFDEALMEVSGPASLTKPLYSGGDIMLDPGEGVSAPVSQPVPLFAPTGWYTIDVDIYLDGEIVSGSCFEVEVVCCD